MASLLNVSSITQGLPSNSDKFLHAFAHAILTGLWFLTLVYSFNIKSLKSLSYASGFAVAFGVAIEVLQGAITQNRVADFNDILANVLGTIVVVLVILGLRFRELKNK
ncbi:MAG: VanZ family protein [Bizionia sp.]|nr:VanZ family protein [Bizionia sp.]